MVRDATQASAEPMLRERLDDDRLLIPVLRYWHVLWEARSKFFHMRIMRAYVWIPCDEEPVYFSCAVADCLLSCEQLWYRVSEGKRSVCSTY